MLQRVLIPFLEGSKAAGYESKSAAYKAAGEGLLPRVVKVGKHAHVPSDEIQSLINARVAGADDDAIRKLVARLHAARAGAA